MNGWWPLFKKECREQLRTNRFLIIAGVLLFFALTTPLTLKYLPEIIKMAGETMEITVPPPTANESLVEFAGTALQIGILLLVLLGMGSISNEYKNNTVLLTLSKPVSPAALVGAKMAAFSLTLGLSLAISSLVCYAYSSWLIGPADFGRFLLQSGLLVLFLLFCLSITLLFSSLFKNGLAAGGLAAVVIILLSLLASLPVIGNYLPGKLPGWGISVINGKAHPYWWALGVTLVTTFMCLVSAQQILRHKEA
jgi:ABC-2 type transport system permease protein